MPSLISEHFTVTELSTLSWLKSRETAFLELWCTPAEGKGDQSYLGRSLHSLRYTVYIFLFQYCSEPIALQRTGAFIPAVSVE